MWLFVYMKLSNQQGEGMSNHQKGVLFLLGNHWRHGFYFIRIRSNHKIKIYRDTLGLKLKSFLQRYQTERFSLFKSFPRSPESGTSKSLQIMHIKHGHKAVVSEQLVGHGDHKGLTVYKVLKQFESHFQSPKLGGKKSEFSPITQPNSAFPVFKDQQKNNFS